MTTLEQAVRASVHVWHTDPGHGWLAVALGSIEMLGIGAQISQCSYVDGAGIAYLEEDCDAPRYLRAFVQRFGVEPTFGQERYWSGEAPMRAMARYTVRVRP